MKLVKSLLLGSAAGLCAAAGAQAADLPMRKAAPVEYVRVCTAHGAGFFYIPGTDTCLRVGGRARFEYQYTSNTARSYNNSAYRGLARLNIDARTQTAYGTLRAFVRLEVASRTGGYLYSGSSLRSPTSFAGVGQDTFGVSQKYVEVDKAFVNFAGFTAGRAASFFDFYAHDVEMIGSSVGSDVSSTNLFAYTATFGGGLSATIAAEDPTFRRVPVFSNGASGGINTAAYTGATAAGGSFVIGGTPLAGIGNGFNGLGVPTSIIALDVQQRSKMPDVVGAIQYDATWGAAKVSGAVHEIRVGSYTGAPIAINGGPVSAATVRIPSAEYGWAVQGGLKLNAPQIAPGDVFWLQAAYGQGSLSYTGISSGWGGYDTQTTGNNATASATTLTDLAYDAQGRAHLTESYSGTVAFLHYWTPEVRQGMFATHGQTRYDSILRTSYGAFSGALGTATPSTANSFNPTLRSFGITYVGSNLIWSPVRDLDIGIEVVYQRVDYRGRVADGTRGGTAAIAGTTVAGSGRTTSTDDNILARFRVQRDF